MSPGAVIAVAGVYLVYSGLIYGIERLFAFGHPILAVAATIALHLLNWLLAAIATSGHSGKQRDRLWLAFGAVIPFAGGAGLVCWGGKYSIRMAGLALMGGTIVPTLLFLWLSLGSLRRRIR